MSQNDNRPAFRELRAAIRGLYRRHGLSRLALIALAWALVGFSLDYFLHLPWLLRFASLGGVAVALAIACKRHLIYPLAQRISDDDIALAIEGQFPELSDKLISAIQLERNLETLAHAETKDMARAIITQADRESAHLSIMSVLDARRINRQVMLAGVLAIAGIAITVTSPTHVRIWLQRNLLLTSTPWPQRVYLKVISPADPGDPERAIFTIAQGNDVDVQVIAEERGEIPDSVWIHYQSGATSLRQGMASSSARPREFGFTFHNVREDLRFFVTGTDDRTREIQIHTQIPPTLNSPTADLEFPDYTRLPPQSLPTGDIKAPQGTRVRFAAMANKPVAHGELIVGSADPKGEQRVRLSISPDQLKVTAEFTVNESTSYLVKLTSVEGMENPRAGVYQITARPDLPPRVRVQKPGRSLQATPVASIDLAGSATDDYGVTSIKFSSSLGQLDEDPEAAAPLGVGEIEVYATAEGAAASTEATFSTMLDLATIQIPETSAAGVNGFRPLRAGDRVVYTFVATDIGPAQEGRSPQFEIAIVSNKLLDRELTAQIKDIQDRLKRMKSEAERVETALGGQVTGDSVARQTSEVTAAELRQGRLTRETRWVEERLEEVREAKERNKIATSEEIEALLSLQTQAESASQGSTAVESALRDAVGSRDDAERRRLLENARKGEQELIAKLTELIRKLSQYEDYQSIVNYIRNMREAQDALLQRAREGIAPPQSPGGTER